MSEECNDLTPKRLSLLWTCGTTLSWAAIDVFASLGTNPTNLVPVRIPRFMLGDRNRRGNNSSKGGRCLINCIRDAKLRLHNAAVAVLSTRIHGKGFVAAARERLLHQESLSRGIISFGKVLALSLKLMPMPERRRFLKGANLLLLCIHLQWIRVALFATPPFYF